MTRAVPTTKAAAGRKGARRLPPTERPPLLEFLKLLDLDGLDLTRERETGPD